MLKRPELLAPVGDMTTLKTALLSGADSVFFGVKGLSMRAEQRNFEINQMASVMSHIQDQGKCGYLALNMMAFDDDQDKIQKILDQAYVSGVDAVIAWDLGVIKSARDRGIAVHLSTQASVSNVDAIALFSDWGVERVVLARECTLEQIRLIQTKLSQRKISCELEVFIHGAMCVSLSGRCLLSAYECGLSANRGQCLQPCRRQYTVCDKQTQTEWDVGIDHIMSAEDLCALPFLDQLVTSQVQALKIEGRMRSPEYIATVVTIYREALGRIADGMFTEDWKSMAMSRLRKVYHRGMNSGFYFGSPNKSYTAKLRHTQKKVFSGEVVRVFPKLGVAEIYIMDAQVRVGDEILCYGKRTPLRQTKVLSLEKDHHKVNCAVKGDRVGIRLPFKVYRGEKVFRITTV